MKLTKSYNPNDFEPSIYALWETSNAFAPSGSGEPFSIVMPPPNANGNLHMGHALTIALEDIMTRYQRMRGRDVIYIPGADHAGFETWVVYEKELAKEGKSRFNFSRDQLYSQVWDFVAKQRGNMELQLRALGASVSWNDMVFTLDEKVIRTVYQTFKRMMDEGLIYRGERIVNYSTAYQTSYADIEVNYKNEPGTLWSIAYPLVEEVGEIVIATTRPETLFGDMAVAVHPDDVRYKGLVGQTVELPLTGRQIPIIADSYVDRTFGTGAVKITPAHDPNDFEMGKRHDLKRIQVIDFDGKMINVPDNFLGLTPEVARKRTLAALKAQDLIRAETPIVHSVGYDYKSGLPIQPLVKDQWFLKIEPLAQAAKQAIIDKQITFTPSGKEKILLQYLDNLRDWNLSRQIPWGIPIPAFQNIADPADWIFDDRVNEKTIVVNGTTYEREEDTFDTWFSSGQWPFITTNALSDDPLARFYPNSVMETGVDLIDRWVARMIMLGLYVTGVVPFKHVYFHGMVLDEHGAKMSKSKNNVINPMEIISSHGSDALRLGVIASRSAGQPQALSMGKVVAGRNFANKLWNIARFIDGQLGEGYIPESLEPISPADHWIIRELNESMNLVTEHLDNYRFAEASEVVYHTIWNSVADWYIEASKKSPNLGVSAWVLETILKLTHPFAPFVSEAIWQGLEWRNDLLIGAAWPENANYDDIAAAEFDRLKQFIGEVRLVVAELPDIQKYSVLYGSSALIEDNADLIKQMTRVKSVTKTDTPEGLKLAASGQEAWLDVSQKTLHQHRNNIQKRLDEALGAVKNLETRLANKSYLDKAPENLVNETKTSLAEKRALVSALQTELEVIGILD